jgi:hypothetical protein
MTRSGWKLVVLIPVTLGVLFAAATWYAHRRLTIGPMAMTDEDRAKFVAAQRILEQTVAGMKSGQVPWKQLDYSSVGSPKEEGVLLQLRRDLGAFEIMFGRWPTGIRELRRLNSAFEATLTQRFHREAIIRACRIVSVRSESYILNCDGWDPPEDHELQLLVGRFDPETEKFYAIQGHVILFVPPFVKNKPLAVG